MSSDFRNSSLAYDETIAFFDFIVKPSRIKTVMSIDELKNSIYDKKFNELWILSEKNNIECFKLIGEGKQFNWTVYYADLETPILFLPIIIDSLKYDDFIRFYAISKDIKTNLLLNYSQEIESIIIWIKKDINKNDFSFHNVKVDEYQKKRINRQIKRYDDEYISFKQWKKRVPFGTRNEINKLNLYTGREWIKFSKSWFIHRPPSRKADEILHPAKFPETMIRQFITFFTKPGDVVLDPFLGSGSTLIAAKQTNRTGIGIELSRKYVEISKKRLEKMNYLPYPPIYQTKERSIWKVIHGNSHDLLAIWTDNSLPAVDFCITSPPYWNQLKRNEIRQSKRKDLGLDTKYSEIDSDDLGNVENYNKFIYEQQKILGHIYEILRPNSYCVLITNNIFFKGRIFPLAYDTAISLTQDKKHPWILKDEKIWLQDDKALVALGVNYAWVGNRCHQFCHIFRKESD